MFEFERATSMTTLQNAWNKIAAKKGTPGVDGVNLELYRSDLQNHLRALQTALITNSYQPYSEKIYVNHKNRAISIHCIDDKIVQIIIAEIILSIYKPSRCVHGFIRNRSIFTAKKRLDHALRTGIQDFSKVDIAHFYNSIDKKLLFNIIQNLIGDKKFLSLTERIIYSHKAGVSTGSSLSPVLSNIYMADFDNNLETASTFYSRYVDDMLVAPADNIILINDKLNDIGLSLNTEKSKPVNAIEGFTYLGFDIKSAIDTAILNNDFALAEELMNKDRETTSTAAHSDIICEPPIAQNTTSTAESLSEEDMQQYHTTAAATANIPAENTAEIHAETTGEQADPPADKPPEYEIPKHINNVIKKCHIIRDIVNRAKEEKYLPYPDRYQLLQIFNCLNEDGAKFLHHVFSNCMDYNYAETQRRISSYNVPNPIGCKKLCERYGKADQCTCNFSQEKMYPTPIIHAKRVTPECYTPVTPKENIGHFKGKTPKHRAEDALAGLLSLNKKAYEIREQQSILVGQIENLFERNNTRELQTPQGLVIKNDDGIFIKVG